MWKCGFNKVALQIALRLGCSAVNLLHIFRTRFTKNTSGRLLLICKLTSGSEKAYPCLYNGLGNAEIQCLV